MKCQSRPESMSLTISTRAPVAEEQGSSTSLPALSRSHSVSSLLAIDIEPSRPPREPRRRWETVEMDGFKQKHRLVVVNPDPQSEGSSEGSLQMASKRRRREVSVISAPRDVTTVSQRSTVYAVIPIPPYSSVASGRECGICGDAIILKPNVNDPDPFSTTPSPSYGISLRCYGSHFGHAYCFPCITTYFKMKLDEAPVKNVFPIRCPECQYIVIEDLASKILKKEDMEGSWFWAKLFGDVQTFFCPNGDCGARIQQPTPECARSIRRTACPACHEPFCYRCQVKWHEGRTCAQYAHASGAITLDRALEKLAKKEKWRRCPKCRIVVERNDGCRHIMCRCGHEFCYNCGREWRNGCGQLRSIICFPTKPQAWPETRSRVVELIRDFFTFRRNAGEAS